ncbi:MAG TPA: Hsp20/alpha crystallin family protein [Steroidobacteraceae bacterium]|nr:Hsp20/alpha crystallin family protein [Steroidobacteraceae bacterium]
MSIRAGARLNAAPVPLMEDTVMATQPHNGHERGERGTPPPAGQGQPTGTPEREAGQDAQPGGTARRGSESPQRSTSGSRPARGELMPESYSGPFGSMLQLSREMDRLWDSVFGRTFGSAGRMAGGWPFEGSQGAAGSRENAMPWMPRIDVRQREDAVLVHADLPGCRKEDVRIESTDEGIAISGERTQQREQGEAGRDYHLSERSYGSFYRNIALPEGAQVEQARARMSDGVLEISIPLQRTQRRRIQIE